jgi:hypothetical protein
LKRILYYITDHGRGHATRSVAIIRELQKIGIEVIIRNSNVQEFLHKSLPNVLVIPGITDVGPKMKNDGVSIDENNAMINIGKWIDKLNTTAEAECQIISKIQPNLIVSDISAMPLLAAKKLQKNCMAISNFSWYDVLKFLPSSKLEILKEAYAQADLAIQLPIGTLMDHFKLKQRVGLVARKPTLSRKQLRQKFGIKDSEFAVSVALGGTQKAISISTNKNVKILSMGTAIRNTNVIDLSDWVEGQEVVLASDFVICKCGYGMISECISNGIPFSYVLDDKHLEQKAMSEELLQRGLVNRITLEKVNELYFDENFFSSLSEVKKEPIETENVIKYVVQFLQN